MACNHLKKLYQLCQEQDLRFSGSDLIRIVCKECGVEDACPSMLQMDSSGEPINNDDNDSDRQDAFQHEEE